MIGELRTVGATVSNNTVHFKFIGGEAINLRRDTPGYYQRIGEWFCNHFNAGPVDYIVPEPKYTGATPDIVRDILSLVMSRCPDNDTIVNWGPADCELVMDWASACYLQASDNDDVIVPEKPAVLVDWEAAHASPA